MQKPRALQLIEKAIQEEIPNLRKLSHNNSEYDLWVGKVHDILAAAFGKNSDEYQWVVRGQNLYATYGNESAQELQRRYIESLTKYEIALKRIIQKYEILGIPSDVITYSEKEGEPPKEAVYPSGSPYDAYKDIKAILIAANKKLIIVDSYVDSTLFTLLENVQPSVQIQILTWNMKGDFIITGKKFKEQREKANQGTLEIRKQTGDIHDRFIASDDRFHHIGASIKDAGSKVFAIIELENSQSKIGLKKIIRESWDVAEKVL